jgi:hypothetical protein
MLTPSIHLPLWHGNFSRGQSESCDTEIGHRVAEFPIVGYPICADSHSSAPLRHINVTKRK